jgi:hypothetical protein
MARGWESKDVETRQEDAESAWRDRQAAEPTAAQRATDLQRESLRLTRTRVEDDLTRATHPRHRGQLEAALAHLDSELAKLP